MEGWPGWAPPTARPPGLGVFTGSVPAPLSLCFAGAPRPAAMALATSRGTTLRTAGEPARQGCRGCQGAGPLSQVKV